MGKQSRLEQEAIEKREDLLLMNDYQSNDEYNEDHKNAKSDGDIKGKGTGVAPFAYLLPDRNAPKTIGKTTVNTSSGGSGLDIQQRETLLNINLYSPINSYGPDSVDTSIIVGKGQYTFIK